MFLNLKIQMMRESNEKKSLASQGFSTITVLFFAPKFNVGEKNGSRKILRFRNDLLFFFKKCLNRDQRNMFLGHF